MKIKSRFFVGLLILGVIMGFTTIPVQALYPCECVIAHLLWIEE
jgi:hypothetical protein